MRIALFSECYTPVTNGVVTSLITLRESLTSLGHTVFVVAPGPVLPDEQGVFRVAELPVPRNPYHFARPFPHLPVDFTSLAVDIVHCQHPFTVGHFGAHLARENGLPMVYTAHSLYDEMAGYARSHLLGSVGASAARAIVRRFCAGAVTTIAPSPSARESLLADGVTGEIAVLPSGVAPPAFRLDGRSRARHLLNLDGDTVLVLYVGRLAPEKRLDILLEAMALVVRRCPPDLKIQLALVGKGPCRHELTALSDTLGLSSHVSFLGAVPHDEIGDWYQAADLFALTSPDETQGMVLVEAMSAALPCVAANSGGPVDILAEGEDGFLVPCQSEPFADAILALARDPILRRRMGIRARERSGRFSPEGMAQAVISVYEAAISQFACAVTRVRAG